MDWLLLILYLCFFLFVTTLLSFYLLYRFIRVMERFLQKTTPLLNIPDTPQPPAQPETDTYTPMNAAGQGVPLETFTPKKGVQVKFVQDTEDEDMITPLEEKK